MNVIQKIGIVLIGIFILCVGVYSGYRIGEGVANTNTKSIMDGLEVRLADSERIASIFNSRLGSIGDIFSKAGIELAESRKRASGVTDKLKRAYLLIEGSAVYIEAIEKCSSFLPNYNGDISNP